MDLHEIGNLLERIAVHYPAFGKQISKDGMMDKAVAVEWMRIIGYLDFDEAISRLDAYMDDPDNRKAPMAVDFKRISRSKSEYFHKELSYKIIQERPVYDQSGNRTGTEKFIKWKVVNGRLYDEEDREYVFDPMSELPFVYDQGGNICQGTITRCYR